MGTLEKSLNSVDFGGWINLIGVLAKVFLSSDDLPYINLLVLRVTPPWQVSWDVQFTNTQICGVFFAARSRSESFVYLPCM